MRNADHLRETVSALHLALFLKNAPSFFASLLEFFFSLSGFYAAQLQLLFRSHLLRLFLLSPS